MVDSSFATGTNSVATASRPSTSAAAVADPPVEMKSNPAAAATSVSLTAGASFAAPPAMFYFFRNIKATRATMRISRTATTVCHSPLKRAPAFIVLSLPSSKASSLDALFESVERPRLHDRSLAGVVPGAQGCTMMGRTKTPCRGAHSKYGTPYPPRYQPNVIHIFIYYIISTDDVAGA